MRLSSSRSSLPTFESISAPCIRNSTHPNIPARTYWDNTFVYDGELYFSKGVCGVEGKFAPDSERSEYIRCCCDFSCHANYLTDLLVSDHRPSRADLGSCMAHARCTTTASLHLYQLARSAVMGRGVGRHLLGLQCILSDEWAWLGNITGASSGIGQGTNTLEWRRLTLFQPSGASVPLF